MTSSPSPQHRLRFSTLLPAQAAACPSSCPVQPSTKPAPCHSSPLAMGSGSQGGSLSLPTTASYAQHGCWLRRCCAKVDLREESIIWGRNITDLWTWDAGSAQELMQRCLGLSQWCRRDTSPAEEQQQERTWSRTSYSFPTAALYHAGHHQYHLIGTKVYTTYKPFLPHLLVFLSQSYCHDSILLFHPFIIILQKESRSQPHLFKGFHIWTVRKKIRPCFRDSFL